MMTASGCDKTKPGSRMARREHLRDPGNKELDISLLLVNLL